MIGKNIVIVLLSCFVFVSCQPEPGWLAMARSDQPEPGLARTNFDHLHKKKYASLGFSLEIPVQGIGRRNKYFEDVADSDLFKKNSNTLGDLSLAFHPIFGTHITSEPVYLINLSISRLSQKQFGVFQKGKHYLLHDPFYRVIPPSLSDDIIESNVYDSLNRMPYEYLYKTINIGNGDILVCLGRVLLLKDEPNLAYDLQQLRSMMNSISILPNNYD